VYNEYEDWGDLHMNIKIIFLLLAVLAVASLCGIAISIAEGSVLAISLCLVAFVGIMGSGFTLKKRWSEKL
jgi:hypothetical protein